MKITIIVGVIALIAGYLIAYTTVPSKVITKEVKVEIESKEQSEVIAELKMKLKTKENIRIVYKDGKVVTKYIDRVILKTESKDTDTKTKVETDKKIDEKTEIKINEKKFIISGSMLVSKDSFSNKTYTVGVLYNAFKLPLIGDLYIGGDTYFGTMRGLSLRIGVGL